MAANVSLSTLRTRVLERVQYENTGAVTNAELNAYINGSIADLYTRLVEAYGAHYFEKSQTISTVAGTEAYALAADFLQLVSVRLSYGGVVIPLRQCSHEELGRQGVSWDIVATPKYMLRATNIAFTPIPPGVFTITLWYVPAPTVLVADGDVFDFVAGWEEYVICDCCTKIMNKVQSDPTPYMAQKAEMLATIMRLAPKRDAGDPARVIDVQRSVSPWLFLP